jgi:RNA polymerase sigma-70 factor (ECF subfamily)
MTASDEDRMPVSEGGADVYLEPAFALLYASEYQRIVALVLVTVGNRGLAEDIAQEAFVSTYRRWARVQHYERPGAFVRRVALNLAVSRLRRGVREVAALERLFSQSRSGALEWPDSFWDLVRRLPRRQRQVVALRYVEDYTVADIAAVLDLAEGTVRAHLHAARQRLAVQLGESEESES